MAMLFIDDLQTLYKTAHGRIFEGIRFAKVIIPCNHTHHKLRRSWCHLNRIQGLVYFCIAQNLLFSAPKIWFGRVTVRAHKQICSGLERRRPKSRLLNVLTTPTTIPSSHCCFSEVHVIFENCDILKIFYWFFNTCIYRLDNRAKYLIRERLSTSQFVDFRAILILFNWVWISNNQINPTV